MDATAKYSFEKQQNDELSFQQGARLKVREYCTDKDDWVEAELDGKVGHVPVSYIDIKPRPWFKNCKTRDEARDLLLKKHPSGKFMYPDGAFLIRRSAKAPGGYSLSVKTGERAQHFMIFREENNRRFYLWDIQRHFDTLNDVVEYYKTASVHQTERIILRDMVEQPDTSGKKLFVARYKFEPRETDELTLAVGDIIALADDSDKDWWKGEVIQGAKKGHTGLFPAQYVSPVPGH